MAFLSGTDLPPPLSPIAEAIALVPLGSAFRDGVLCSSAGVLDIGSVAKRCLCKEQFEQRPWCSRSIPLSF